MIKEATQKLSSGQDLDATLMKEAMEEIMTGQLVIDDIVAFLVALNNRGETVEELTAAAEIMRLHATPIHVKSDVILDTCGTGADSRGTFNISTIVAFVASACGITVAKHGNRSISSSCGSADILEALGVNINLTPEKIERCLEEVGIAFLFAQVLHPAMKYAMPARKKIAAKTIFNVLGPLSNPSGATHQLVGVYDKRWMKIVAQVLRNLGSCHALVVHGKDGLDEVTTTTETLVSEANKEGVRSYEITPEDFGFKRASLEDLKGNSVAGNVQIWQEVLNGKAGPQRDIVMLNAGCAIYAADKVNSIQEGIKLAAETIDTKKALKKLELLKSYSNRV